MKKYQIFISSTYTDLLLERQAAVQAVLRAGHIPAGMELFSAGNKSQLDTIKKWINESDIYVLILGGRYGSLEPQSGLSYTEIEYRYALELEKPLFAVVLNEEMMNIKIKREGISIIETTNHDKYKNFKDFVLSKVCRLCRDENEIKLAILESIIDIQNQFKLTGWIKGSEILDSSVLLKELDVVRKERDEFEKKVISLEGLNKKPTRNRMIGEYSYEEITKVLESKPIEIPAKMTAGQNDITSNALKVFVNYVVALTAGVTLNTHYGSEQQKFLIVNLVPILLNFKLLERQKVKIPANKIEYDKFFVSDLGNKYLSIYNLDKVEKKIRS